MNELSSARTGVRPVPAGSAAAQRGAALIVALIMLMIMSLVAFGSMRQTNVQERVTANYYDRALIFQRIDRTLRTGEDDGYTTFDPLNEGDLPDYYHSGDPTRLSNLTAARWMATGTTWNDVVSTDLTDYKGPAVADTQYIVESYRVPAPGEIGRGATASGFEHVQNVRLRITARVDPDELALPEFKHRARTVLQSTTVLGVPRN